ncbi:aldehyde dehydrogenase [Paenibacillus sp. PL2-23]|uniref:aldehyde dehydrogenase n=1 Tax=Paenibacillus sp. PL2-23 TaxID=2100729 RepID=UPI0030F65A95
MTTHESVHRMLEEHRAFFRNGRTAEAAFRIQQLTKLKQAIVSYERELLDALYQDLRKNEAEAYGSEIGIVLSSITHMTKKLRGWMKPRRIRTPLQLFGTSSRVMMEPYGTVLIIGPFNYPVQLVLEPLVGAIAAGNCAIVKPSESTPRVSAVLARLVADTFDPGYIRVVEGEKEITSALIHAPFDYIFFTGSTAVGKLVMEAAAQNLVPVTLELGGKSPVIVDRTANVALAAKRIAWGKLMNAGQTCIAPDYVLVEKSVKEALLKELRETIRTFYGDNPQESGDYGRMVNARQYDRLAAILDADRDMIVSGGRTSRGDLYMEPTLLDLGDASGKAADAASMADELFGPILPVISYTHLDEALDWVRNRSKPLALYVFSEDRAVQDRVLGSLSFGGGCVNDTISHIINPSLPFGGVGASGMGAYHGKHSFELFSHRKSVLKRSTRFETGILFPPYGDKLKWIRKVLK